MRNQLYHSFPLSTFLFLLKIFFVISEKGCTFAPAFDRKDTDCPMV